MSEAIQIQRTTKETDISVTLDMLAAGPSLQKTTLPFFNHMLNAMAFHGGFRLEISGTGDIEVDPHHLVEDCGLVIGQAMTKSRERGGAINRYGHAVIPMDDALAEVTVDVGGRPYLDWRVNWPQSLAGNFDLNLLKEFFWGLATSGKMNLHVELRHAENGHHGAEAIFKATGRALAEAYQPKDGDEGAMSTKGII